MALFSNLRLEVDGVGRGGGSIGVDRRGRLRSRRRGGRSDGWCGDLRRAAPTVAAALAARLTLAVAAALPRAAH